MKLDPENYDSYVGYKVKLFPTEEQKEIFNKYFGACRFVYNLVKDLYEYESYGNGETPTFISLDKNFAKLKHTDDYNWLLNFDAGCLKITVKDLYNAYRKFETGLLDRPKYRSYKKSSKQFPVRDERLSILEDSIKLPSIGWIKYSNSYGNSIIGTGYKERIDKSLKYLKYTAVRVIFDGCTYWLTFSLPKDQEHNINSYQYYYGNTEWQQKKYSEAIGIDAGLKHEKWMIDSTGYVLERPNSEKYYKKLNKLYKKLNRQYHVNNNREPRLFKDRKAPENGESKNMQKTKIKINKYCKKISNRRRNTVYNYCNRLLKLKPEMVVMEGLEIKKSITIHDDGMIVTKHKHDINALVQDAALYESMKIIERTMISNNIKVKYVDSQYPSSQLCSNCGYKQKIGKHKIYRCPECGLVIDRDLNAALNLKSQAYLKCPVKRLS